MNLATGLKLSVMGITEELERFFLPGGSRSNRLFLKSLATRVKLACLRN